MPEFAHNSLAALTTIYNEMVIKADELKVPGTWVQVKGFKDKPRALARVEKLNTALTGILAGNVLDATSKLVELDPCPKTVTVKMNGPAGTAPEITIPVYETPPRPTGKEAALKEVMLNDGASKKVNGHALEDGIPAMFKISEEARKEARDNMPVVAPVVEAPLSAPTKTKKEKARWTGTITLLAASNPKKFGSKAYARFALYATGMLVDEFLKAGGTAEDLRWDTQHKFIEIK